MMQLSGDFVFRGLVFSFSSGEPFPIVLYLLREGVFFTWIFIQGDFFR